MENVDNIVAKGEIACFKQFPQNCSKILIPLITLVAAASERGQNVQTLKNLLLQICLSDSNIIC